MGGIFGGDFGKVFDHGEDLGAKISGHVVFGVDAGGDVFKDVMEEGSDEGIFILSVGAGDEHDADRMNNVGSFGDLTGLGAMGGGGDGESVIEARSEDNRL